MADELSCSSIEPSKVDAAASDACTRAGAFALLLSVVLFLLIPYWAQRQNETALRQYLVHRLNLALRLDALDNDPYWREFSASHITAESMSVAQLLAARVETSGSRTHTDKAARPAAPGTGPSPESRMSPPPPPQILSVSVTVTIVEMSAIADLLKKLNDSKLLTESRGYSNVYDFSIARWDQKLTYLVFRNQVANACFAKPIQIPNEGRKSEQFVPMIDNQALLRCLTLRDVREIAQFELPAISNPQVGGRVEREIEVTPGSLPRDLYWASAFAQVLLFFVVVYFGAFAREAVSSEAFPAQGTLFSAFARSPLTLLVLLLVLWFPAIAALGVAAMSREWLLAICSVLVFSAVLSAHVALQRKSYFGSLNPRNAKRGQGT